MTVTQVYVVWVDSTFMERPESLDFDCAVLHTVGWLVSENKRQLTIAMEISPDETPATYRDLMAIPKVCIKQRRDRRVRLLQNGGT